MGIKILVTGAGGYLGSVLAAQLSQMPDVDGVTGTINNNQPRQPLPEKVSLVKMDIRSPELYDLMAGHDFVVHTALVVLWRANMPEAVRDDINLNGTRNVAEAARKNKVSGLLHASSVSAYDPVQVRDKDDIKEDFPLGTGDSDLFYWNSKARAEMILNESLAGSGIPLTHFRISYIIGPWNFASIPAFRKNAATFPGQNPKLQFVHEDDVAEAFKLAIRNPMPRAYNVVPDDDIRMQEVYEIIGAKPLTIPVWLARRITYVRWRYLGSDTHPSFVDSALINFSLSNARLKAAGWQTRYNCAEAIRTAL